MKRLILTFLFSLFLSISVFSQEAKQFDEFPVLFCDDYLARMDGVINTFKNYSNSRMYVLVYEGKIPYQTLDNFVLPRRGEAKAKISSMKKYFQKRGISEKDIVFVNAGFREKLLIEFWTVPNGSSAPIPAPTLNKIEYRKGKPVGFCLSCCGD